VYGEVASRKRRSLSDQFERKRACQWGDVGVKAARFKMYSGLNKGEHFRLWTRWSDHGWDYDELGR